MDNFEKDDFDEAVFAFMQVLKDLLANNESMDVRYKAARTIVDMNDSLYRRRDDE